MTAATFAGIHNENEFYSHHYLSEIFAGDLRATVERWRGAAEAGGGPTPYAALRALAGDYVRFRRDFERERRAERRLALQRAWFRRLLAALGYDQAPAGHPLDDGGEIPVLCAAGGAADAPALLALGAYDAEAEGEDPLALLHRGCLLPPEGPSLLDDLVRAHARPRQLRGRRAGPRLRRRGAPESCASIRGSRSRA